MTKHLKTYTVSISNKYEVNDKICITRVARRKLHKELDTFLSCW